jgi:hypothetical protein
MTIYHIGYLKHHIRVPLMSLSLLLSQLLLSFVAIYQLPFSKRAMLENLLRLIRPVGVDYTIPFCSRLTLLLGSSAWATNRKLHSATKQAKKDESPTESAEEAPAEEPPTEEVPAEEPSTVTATSELPDSEPVDLWGGQILASDLAQMSILGNNEAVRDLQSLIEPS